MRIVHLLKSISRSGGGASTSACGLAKVLAENKGLEQTVFALGLPAEEKDIEFWGGLPVSTFQTKGPSSFSYAPNLWPALREFNPDIIHLHGLWAYTSIAAQRASKKLGSKTVISIHGMLNPWAVDHKGFKKTVAARLYERNNMENAACLHALSDVEAEHIRNFGLRAPVAVISNGIERPPITSRTTNEDFKTLLFLGRIHPVKGVEELLKGWALYRSARLEHNETWRLSLVGGGEEKFILQMQELAQQLGIQDSVTFEGPRYGADLWTEYDNADAFVLSSLSEAMPMAVLEAMASGLPVLMTRESGMHQAFDIGAALPMSLDPEDISQAIVKLASMTDKERSEMGATGLTLVKQDFSWLTSAKSLLDVYNWTLKGGATPQCIIETQ